MKRTLTDGEKGIFSGEGDIIYPENPYFVYCGRIGTDDEGLPEFVYPCSFVKFDFYGDFIRAIIKNHSVYWDNYVGWILDGRQYRGRLEKDGHTQLTLGEGLGQGKHSLMLFKRQDSCHTFSLAGFQIAPGGRIEETTQLPERRIEFYGDSVSAGEVSEAVEYTGREDPKHHGEYSNSWYSYAWIAARMLDACIHNISQGGIALMNGIGWFEPPEYTGMESVYDKIQYHSLIGRICKWDFAKYRPHVVVVALGQNDSHPKDFMKEAYEGPEALLWRQHYESFIKGLRGKYPDAVIVLSTTLLYHDKSWDRAIEEVCRRLNDQKVYHYVYQRNGCGTPGHLRIGEAEEMAEELVVFLRSLGDWIWKPSQEE